MMALDLPSRIIVDAGMKERFTNCELRSCELTEIEMGDGSFGFQLQQVHVHIEDRLADQKNEKLTPPSSGGHFKHGRFFVTRAGSGHREGTCDTIFMPYACRCKCALG